MKIIPPLILLVLFGFACSNPERGTADRSTAEIGRQSNNYSDLWTIEEANAWYQEHDWLVGCNFSPSTAINQLEMWQEDTFDPETINRELGWAEDLGFNTARVYLHDLLWEQDSTGFLDRIDEFLEISDSHGIKVMFVLLDRKSV